MRHVSHQTETLTPDPDATANDREDCGYSREAIEAAPEVELEDDDA